MQLKKPSGAWYTTSKKQEKQHKHLTKLRVNKQRLVNHTQVHMILLNKPTSDFQSLMDQLVAIMGSKHLIWTDLFQSKPLVSEAKVTAQQSLWSWQGGKRTPITSMPCVLLKQYPLTCTIRCVCLGRGSGQMEHKQAIYSRPIKRNNQERCNKSLPGGSRTTAATWKESC